MASPEAVELIHHLSKLLAQREYKPRPGGTNRKGSWRPKYIPADLAEFIDRHAHEFHARRLSDAGFELVPKKGKAA